MRSSIAHALVLASVLSLASACATSEEWAEWRGHPAHFASGEHVMFSFRNREGTPVRVSRTDLDQARAQEWWGKVITVEREQLIQQ